MAERDFNEYRRDVGTKVFRITEVLDHIAQSDFSKRVDIADDDGDGFGKISQRLNELADDLEKGKRERDEQALIGELRSRMWQYASEEGLGEQELIRRLLETVGSALRVSRACFMRLYPEQDKGVCEVLWCSPGERGEMGTSFPLWVVTRFLTQPYHIVTPDTLPDDTRAVLGPLLTSFGTITSLVIPYGSPEAPAGLLTFSSCVENREWTQAEIGICLEVARIAKSRSDRVEAQAERVRIHEELERKVAEQTAHLEAANRTLQQDIVDLKMAEEAIKENEEKFRAVAEGAHEAIISIDTDVSVVFWNRGAEIMFGYGAHEMMGKRGDILVPEPYRAPLNKKIEDMVLGDSSLNGRIIELEGMRKDGGLFPVELSVSPWRSRDRIFFTAVIRDITERKKVERALAAEKKLLDVTLSSIADGVVTADAEGRILLLNSAAAALTGWSQTEALGASVREVLGLQDPRSFGRLESPFDRVLKTGHHHGPIEAVVISRSGEEHTVTVTAAPIRDGDNKVSGVVLALRDITEKQRMEDELFKARKLESVGLLAGGIAHDFNNILTGIVTNLFMAKMSLKKDDEAYLLINEAEAATFRASKLTKQLLTFSKGGAPVKESVSIRELIEESVGFSLSGSNVDCTLVLPEDLWSVDIDRGQIDQVLNNLIINADQAMPDGGTVTVVAENIVIDDEISDSTEVRIPLGAGKYVKISVVDEGVGIPRKNLHRIFDPYFTTKKNASGLGLTTVFSIVRKHGGFITAKSTPGKGSTFIFYLPASAADDDEEPRGESLPLGSARILVMDDDEVVRVVIEKLLVNAGHTVRCVADGSEAITVYATEMEKGNRFDAVIMDLTVPGGKGGKEAVKELLAIDPEAKVIVASGYSNDPIMSEFEKYGFCDVIKKPFSIEEFSRVIRNVVGE